MEPLIDYTTTITSFSATRRVNVPFSAITFEKADEKTAPKVTFDGHEFYVLTELFKSYCEYVSVYLAPVDTTRTITVSYQLRMVGTTTSKLHEPITKKFDGSIPRWGAIRFVEYQLFRADYCVNGECTIEIVFDYVRQENVTYRIGALDTLKFTDFIVKYGGLEIPCHKFIMANECKAIDRALSDKRSHVFNKTDAMDMTNDSATEETVRLFVQAIYEGWIEHLMDKHAVELLRLANSLECDTVASLVIAKFKRLLTDETFWETCAIAVDFKDSRPTLLHACAQYVCKPRDKYDRSATYEELCLRDDNKTAEHSHILSRAVANLKKSKKVLKKKTREVNSEERR